MNFIFHVCSEEQVIAKVIEDGSAKAHHYYCLILFMHW